MLWVETNYRCSAFGSVYIFTNFVDRKLFPIMCLRIYNGKLMECGKGKGQNKFMYRTSLKGSLMVGCSKETLLPILQSPL